MKDYKGSSLNQLFKEVEIRKIIYVFWGNGTIGDDEEHKLK